METESGAEYISEVHVRHIMRYVQARDWLPKYPMTKIWDAACGTGYGTRILAKHGYPIGSIEGIDFSEDAIIEAERFGKEKNISFCRADFMSEIFMVACNAARAYAIVSIETLEHFNKTDGEKLLSLFHSALVKDGVLIVSTPYCEHSGPSPITKQHLYEYSLSDFEEVLHKTGFEIDAIKINRHDGQFGRRGYCMAKAIKI